MSKKIATCDEFAAALLTLPYGNALRSESAFNSTCELRSYALWRELCDRVNEAIQRRDWMAVRQLTTLYDRAMLAEKKGEMWEASYVTFLEDVRLPEDRSDLREFWRHAAKRFSADIGHDRRLRRQ